MTEPRPLADRVATHAALGEPHRLEIVDELRLSDRTPSQLRERLGLASNLLSFHLDVLEGAGLIERARSEGDSRRRYVTLRWEALGGLQPDLAPPEGPVVFVCSRNAARSQLAAALWRDRLGPAASAGTEPADRIDALAEEVAAEHGLALTGDRPRPLADVTEEPAVVVSVCDRARESGLPWPVEQWHWSVPDPAGGPRADYERAFDLLGGRIDRLAAAGRPAA